MKRRLRSMESNTTSTGFLGWLALLFIALKLTGYLAWSWVWVLAPIWIPICLVLGVFIVWLLLTVIMDK